MNIKSENDLLDGTKGKKPEKPQYEKPKLIKLEDEIKWSRGGVACSAPVR